jgi:hypothetical protein
VLNSLEQLFPVGSKVLLRYSASTEIGQVIGHESGRTLVHWPLWGRAGHYTASFLERVDV